MSQLKVCLQGVRRARRASIFFFIFVFAFIATGCGSLPGVRRKVAVAQLLAPIETADVSRLFQEVNKLAGVESLRGKVDIQFLDTSFARCGVAEKYRTADGEFILQRPGKVSLKIQVPFVGTNVAQMTSDGTQFRVAVLQGDEKYRRFVKGTNSANYQKLETDVTEADCGDDNPRERAATQRRAVGALSGLRPQHFTDALLIRPVAQAADSYIYAQSEFFQEEADERTSAQRKGTKSNGRVVKSYYLLDELATPAINANGDNQARLVRRFWFDRYQGIRLARLQTFDEQGQLTTDVVYRDQKQFGANAARQQTASILDTPVEQLAAQNGNAGNASINLPSRIDVTRPQDRYSIRITYQAPESVMLNRQYGNEVFVLQNESNLPEVDLDK